MVTGPMPRKPKATSPKAKTLGASMSGVLDPGNGSPRPNDATKLATAIKAAMMSPIQYALKLPAVNPASTLSDAPPSFEASTHSRTCAELVEVKILIASGMTAPATVPHVMIVDSFHQSDPSPSPPSS